MLFKETSLTGAYVLELERRTDERGFFARAFCERELEAAGLPTRFPQCNISRNDRRGTLRGMHYNLAPFSEAKLVRCMRGAIYDVIVDLRAGSATAGQWTFVELSADDGLALFVPEGFAHGFITLQDDTDVFYHMGRFFEADAARGFRFDDPAFRIRWPMSPTVISERDASFPAYDGTTFEVRR